LRRRKFELSLTVSSKAKAEEHLAESGVDCVDGKERKGRLARCRLLVPLLTTDTLFDGTDSDAFYIYKKNCCEANAAHSCKSVTLNVFYNRGMHL
jgi:hypothetical protein